MPAGCPPLVQATCVHGCIQLLASIIVPQASQLSSDNDAAAALQQLQGKLQQQVRSRLQDLNPGQPLPQLSMSTVSSVGSPSMAGQLLHCSPTCLAAGGGSIELALAVAVAAGSGGVVAATSAAAPAAPELATHCPGGVAARLVVWEAGQSALVDVKRMLHPGSQTLK